LTEIIGLTIPFFPKDTPHYLEKENFFVDKLLKKVDKALYTIFNK